MSKHATQLATLHLVSDPPTGAQRASLVGWEADRGILVRLAGDGRTLPAQSLVAFDAASLTEAIARQAEVLVLCEATTGTPMILGVIHEPPSLAPSEATPEEPLETRVDGERVVLEGKQEIVLRCGASSITLHADGRGSSAASTSCRAPRASTASRAPRYASTEPLPRRPCRSRSTTARHTAASRCR